MTTRLRSRMCILRNRNGEFIGMVAIPRATEHLINVLDVNGRYFWLKSNGMGGLHACWFFDEPIGISSMGALQ